MSERQLVLSSTARAVRRSLSKPARDALLELAWDCDACGDVGSSARKLGPYIGSSKDTANRAINELVAAGLASIDDDRSTSTDGGTVIRIDLAAAGITVVTSDESSIPCTSTSSSRPRTTERRTSKPSTTSHGQQLDLFAS